ncbi:hypothetical protein [Paenibacillus sp. NEAU-GSW1]|uniref:hypothetical protein n=1 Tax=Paenibacillus sp. NEAU-GSW1 TaxID=2682486 RepID=UPI0012E1909B|nr:hypothetical protein [Paenibacillus sp. NEAU-GSW1]MUT66085.1 hypothetical protein [Paenibacillus sp. NEAU-GSW1]
MDSSLRRNLGVALIAAAVFVFCLALSGCDSNEDSKQETSGWEARWQEADKWAQAEGTAWKRTDEPLVLFKDKDAKKVVYVQKDALYAEQDDEADSAEPPKPQRLLELPSDSGVYLRNGNTLLIGAKLNEEIPDNSMRGEWHAVMLDGAAPRAVKLESGIHDPERLLSVTVDAKQQTFLLVFQEDGSNRETVYHAGADDFAIVEYGYVEDAVYAQYVKLLEARKEQAVFQKEAYLEAKDGVTAGVYEDDRGTLFVTTTAEGYLGAVRYPLQIGATVSWKTSSVGQSQVLAFIQNQNGERTAVMPFLSSSYRMEALPELAEDGWLMVNERMFYNADNNRIETVHYVGDWPNMLKAERRSFDIASLKLSIASARNGELIYNPDGGEGNVVKLSVFDLINANEPIERLLIRGAKLSPKPLQAEPNSSEQFVTDAIEQRLPQAALDYLLEEAYSIPQQVKEIMDGSSDPCLFCDPDGYYQPQVRSIDGVWHMLYRESMYRIDEEAKKLVLIGKWPVSEAVTSGEGANLYTAQDYVYADGFWYVADTFANRVTKLDDKFSLVAEVKLASPYRMTKTKSGSLLVDSLQGVVELGREKLNVIAVTDAKAKKLRVSDTEDQPPVRVLYVDKTNGNTWFDAGGFIGIYNKQLKQISKAFVGYNKSGSSSLKVLPYQKQMLVVLDHKLEIFSASGKWERTIPYPEQAQTYVCSGWSQGQNSTILDAEQGILYTVHGCAVIAVDIDKGEAKLLFQQNEAAIGKLAYIREQHLLMFSLDGVGRYGVGTDSPFKGSNELVVMRLSTGESKRLQFEKGWLTSGAIKDNQQLLFSSAGSAWGEAASLELRDLE